MEEAEAGRSLTATSLERVYVRLRAELVALTGPPPKKLVTKASQARAALSADELAGRIEALRGDMAAFERVMRHFEPDWTPARAKVVLHRERRLELPHGVWTKTMAEVAKEADRWMTVGELARGVCDRLGLDTSDQPTWRDHIVRTSTLLTNNPFGLYEREKVPGKRARYRFVA